MHPNKENTMKTTFKFTTLAALLMAASFTTQAQVALGDVAVGDNTVTITTAGPDERTASGTDALWIDDLEISLALPGYSLGSDAFEGSAYRQSLTAAAGSTFSFSWTLNTDAFDAKFTDRAFAVINGNVLTLGSVAAGTVSGRFSHTFATAGLYTVSLGVVDVNDTTGISSLSVSNVNVSAVPEPETYALLLAGLGLMGAVARKRRA
jgi:hypothetical protein